MLGGVVVGLDVEAGLRLVGVVGGVGGCGAVRCGAVRCGAVRCGVVWCGVVWCGVGRLYTSDAADE